VGAVLMPEYVRLRAAVSDILRATDPIGLIASGAPADEYDPEIDTLLPRLREAESADDALRLVHEGFVRWFGPEQAGPLERYQEVAQRVWQEWLRYSALR
jgi:broad specificity phosphatase PhoE